MSDFDAQIDDFLISKVKDVVSSATSYSLQEQQVSKFSQFRSILKYGYLYSFDKSSFGAIRGCATRLDQENQSISAGEFYKNTILGVIFDQPSYDGHARWIIQERYLNDATFSNVCTSLHNRFPSNKDMLLIGSDSDGNLLLDSLGSIIDNKLDLKIESFGEESYAK